MLECATGRRVAYVRLEDPPGLSPITTVGGFDTVEEAQVATDEVSAARWPHADSAVLYQVLPRPAGFVGGWFRGRNRP
jgi:hypothetical protein